MNDPVINAPISRIVEAINNSLSTMSPPYSKSQALKLVTEALASLGGDGNTTLKSAFSILQKHHDFIQKNGEKPSEYVEDCILRAMEEYASQFTHTSNREVLEGFKDYMNKINDGNEFHIEIDNNNIDRYLAEKQSKTEKK